MTANLIAICGTALSGLLLFVVEWLKQGQVQKTGEMLQAADANQQAAVVETAIAQAVVTAPTTKMALIDQLRAGGF